MKRLVGYAAALTVAAMALTGCSQVAQLQPVAGDSLSTVRSVTIDTVLESGKQFKTVPVCTAEGEDITCQGLTTDSQVVASTGQSLAKSDIPSEFADQVPGWATDSDTFVVAKVTVGQDVLYDGVALEALDEFGSTSQ
jgi:hypothetical protein